MAPAIGSLPGEAPFKAAIGHPAFDALRPWLGGLETGWPDSGALNALAAKAPNVPTTASGQSVRFQLPQATAQGHYEQRIFDTGLVDTRPRNLHDLFNALAWIAFPQAKAAINARHAARLPLDGTSRGALRDLLTLVDEGGVLVACPNPGEIEPLIREFRWQELFWHRRAELLREVRFVLLGHSAYEKALTPYPGITCKALFVATPLEQLRGPQADLVAWLDRSAAQWLQALPDSATPRQMAPLPVFGYPGWLPASDCAAFYADRRWFRPARQTQHAPDSNLGAQPICV